jgi:hypothetical protein
VRTRNLESGTWNLELDTPAGVEQKEVDRCQTIEIRLRRSLCPLSDEPGAGVLERDNDGDDVDVGVKGVRGTKQQAN